MCKNNTEVAALLSFASFAETKKTEKQAAPAKFTRVVLPIYSQKVAFKIPAAWKEVFKEQKDGVYTIEYVPGKQDKSSWTRMVSVQGFENLAGKVTAVAFVNKLQANFQNTCGKDLVAEPLGETVIDGYKAFSAILGCSKMPGKDWSEVGFYAAIQGDKDLYLIRKSARLAAFEHKKSPLTKATTSKFIANILPIELCKAGGRPGQCQK
ncbi:MAG: hypothetical protein GC138_03445 [Gammaproteobacteria bacterium]|nr:hypothetical protein [Gammaproteobacteria bacterium]